MIYTKIYKLKILKEEKKLFDLWWQDLIKLQKQYIKVIQKILDEQFKETIKELEKDTELKYNDIFIDQTQFIDKDFAENANKFIDMLYKATLIWIKQLNKLFSKEVTVDASFWLKPAEALEYAKELAGDRITKIDNYTKTRINSLLVQWLEKWRWYKKLASELKKDYWFSTYRATLIASNEIWTAYIQWKDMQFAKYKSEYWQVWWKKWISHKDDRTTEGCLWNDEEWWIEYDQEFKSWHKTPPRFPWCRCNIVYRLFKPTD